MTDQGFAKIFETRRTPGRTPREGHQRRTPYLACRGFPYRLGRVGGPQHVGFAIWVSVNRKGRWNGGFIDTSLLSQIRQQVRKIQHCYQLLNHHLMSLFVLSFVHSRLCSLNWSVNWSLIFLSSLWAHAHTDTFPSAAVDLVCMKPG